MQHLIIRSPPSASPNQNPYNTFLSGNQLRLAASSVAYQRQPSSGCESRCHLSSLVSPLSALFWLRVYFHLLPVFRSLQKILPCISLRVELTWKDFIFHCCFFGTDSPGVWTLGKSCRCPILPTFYDTVPCDMSVLLREHHKMDLYLAECLHEF